VHTEKTPGTAQKIANIINGIWILKSKTLKGIA
jgi:hypothetical protein